MATYPEYLRQTFKVDLPGRKSQERKAFEQFGTIPNIRDILETNDAVALHHKIVQELQARDDALRQADREWFDSTEDQPQAYQGRPTQQSAPNATTEETKSTKHPFLMEVDRLKAQKGIDSASAMRELISTQPKLYEQFMNKK